MDDGLGSAFARFSDSHAKPAAEKYHFHNSHTSGVLTAEPLRTYGRFRDRNNEFSSPVTNKGHLLHDFISQIPGQNQQVIRLRFADFFRSMNGNVCAWRKSPLLVRVPINGVVEKIFADSTVVQQCIALARSSIAYDGFAAFL